MFVGFFFFASNVWKGIGERGREKLREREREIKREREREREREYFLKFVDVIFCRFSLPKGLILMLAKY